MKEIKRILEDILLDNEGNIIMDKIISDFYISINNYLKNNGKKAYEDCMFALYLRFGNNKKITHEGVKMILKINYGSNFLSKRKDILNNYINYILINQNSKMDISNNKYGWAEVLKYIIKKEYFNTDGLKKFSETVTEIRNKYKL